MSRRQRIAFLLALATAFSAAPHAWSQAPSPASPDGTDPADVAFRRANALYKQQRYAEAKAAFEEAFRLKKSHDIASNLAYAELKLGQNRDAAEHLAFAVKNWPPTGKTENRASAVHWLGIAKAAVTTVKITVSAEGATVLVDGKAVGTSPLDTEVFVEPGSRTVEAKLTGYKDARETIQATKGAELSVALTLDRESAVDPYARGAGPGVVPSVPPSPGGPRTGLLIAGGSVAGVALIAGIAFMVVRGSKTSDAATQRSELVKQGGAAACGAQPAPAGCDALHDTLKARATFGDLGAASFIIAGAAGAATLIYGVAAPRRASGADVRVVPAVSALGGGVVLQGSW
jgi:hypothetical protein